MTSQKRYRQHQESNKNNSRFRDLPPRFKRQKSAVSSESSNASATPTAVAPEAEAAATVTSVVTATPAVAAVQQDTEIIHLPAVKTEPQQSISSAMAPSNLVYPVKESQQSQLRSKQEGQQSQLRSRQELYQVPITTAESWRWPVKTDTNVLSQWDNRQFNRASNVQPQHVPIGTHFGYKMDSPPLSPWGSSSNVIGQSGMTGSPAWMNPASDLYSSQAMQSPSMYFNNENWPPNQSMYPQAAGGQWSKPSIPQNVYNSPSAILQGHASSPVKQDHAHLSSRYVGNHTTASSGAKPQVDYTDPDIRTIEMLRELERVADEKDSEDFGVDRKSLVSHHLRMLMCAVDKYTEGVEDETSRRDEVSLTADSGASTPRISPVPVEVKEMPTMMNNVAKLGSGNTSWSSDCGASSWNNQGIQDSSAARQEATSAQHHRAILQQASEQPTNSTGGQNVPWDLWFSPSFDFSGLLNQNLDDLTHSPFSGLKERNEKDRKPLYRR